MPAPFEKSNSRVKDALEVNPSVRAKGRSLQQITFGLLSAFCFCSTKQRARLKSPSHGLRFHDLRHHAIIELAETLASDQTIMSIAGHVSLRMLAHYSHVRLDAKRKALDALSAGSLGPVTSQNLGVPRQILEKNGGDDGTRNVSPP